MAMPQPGMFAQGTRSHHHLELDVHPGASTDAVAASLRLLRGPAVTEGGANIVVGVGAGLARRLLPHSVPDALSPFVDIEGIDDRRAPASQHDLWIWLHGSGPDVVLDAALGAVGALAPAAGLVAEQACFVYKDSRDLTGFSRATSGAYYLAPSLDSLDELMG